MKLGGVLLQKKELLANMLTTLFYIVITKPARVQIVQKKQSADKEVCQKVRQKLCA